MAVFINHVTILNSRNNVATSKEEEYDEKTKLDRIIICVKQCCHPEDIFSAVPSLFFKEKEVALG
jgi:hypothetical protein